MGIFSRLNGSTAAPTAIVRPPPVRVEKLQGEHADRVREVSRAINGHLEKVANLALQIRQLEKERDRVADEALAERAHLVSVVESIARERGIDPSAHKITCDLERMTLQIERCR